MKTSAMKKDNATNGNGSHGNSSSNPSVPLRVANSMDPDSFTFHNRPFIDRLVDYAIQESGQMKLAKDKDKKYYSEWLGIHRLPNKIVTTLDKMRNSIPTNGTIGSQMAIRCAVSIGLDIVKNDTVLTEFSRLCNYFQCMPQTGKSSEEFVSAYLKARPPIHFEGDDRKNVPCTPALNKSLTDTSVWTYIPVNYLATWSIHAAITIDSNEIPANYRQEWENKLEEIRELLAMKNKGLEMFIRELGGDPVWTRNEALGVGPQGDYNIGLRGPIEKVSGGLSHRPIGLKGGVEDREDVEMRSRGEGTDGETCMGTTTHNDLDLEIHP